MTAIQIIVGVLALIGGGFTIFVINVFAKGFMIGFNSDEAKNARKAVKEFNESMKVK